MQERREGAWRTPKGSQDTQEGADLLPMCPDSYTANASSSFHYQEERAERVEGDNIAHLFIHYSLTQLIFIECLWCASHQGWFWEYEDE